MSEQTFLKPNVSAPLMLRKKRNGMFVNPPLMMTLGGFTSSDKIRRGSTANLSLESGGPQAKGKKPL